MASPGNYGQAQAAAASPAASAPRYAPIAFHEVHGDNIRLTKNGTVACRAEGFCKGITFSNRPIKVNEHVYVKFLDVSTSWTGALRIGFTANNPSSFCSSLPRCACPDLTNKPGNWAKAVAEVYAEKGSIIFYYVDESGDVHYGVDRQDRGVFFSGVNTSARLWALLDVYGNTRTVEIFARRRNPARPRNPISSLSSSSSSQPTPSASSSPPFAQSSDGHPSFLPVRLGCGGSGADRVPEAPKPPDKPMIPRMRYRHKVLDEVKAQNPDLKSWEIGRMISQMWRELPDELKKEYVDDYEAEKMEYNEALDSYYNSPATLAWVAANVRGLQAAAERVALETSPAASLIAPQKMEDKVCVQPSEDDADEFPVKHGASAYLRNCDLINKIVNDTIVPVRIRLMKRQLQSVKIHQKKLEVEKQQVEEEFEAMTKKFLERSEVFRENLKKGHINVADPTYHRKMLDHICEQMKEMRILDEQNRTIQGDSVDQSSPKEPVNGTVCQQGGNDSSQVNQNMPRPSCILLVKSLGLHLLLWGLIIHSSHHHYHHHYRCHHRHLLLNLGIVSLQISAGLSLTHAKTGPAEPPSPHDPSQST